jgi:hypothetical protein
MLASAYLQVFDRLEGALLPFVLSPSTAFRTCAASEVQACHDIPSSVLRDYAQGERNFKLTRNPF